MLGIVLCGGQSLRMGSDKGLLVNGHKSWSQHAVAQLSALNIPVKLAINPKQHQAYASYFDQSFFIVDNALPGIHGPLLGILSAHLSAPAEDLFVLACDLIRIDRSVLQQMLSAFESNGDYEAYVFNNAGQQEPLCGIYTAMGLNKIQHLLHNEGIAKPSMKFVLSKLKVFEIALQADEKYFFANFNSPDDLQ
jgi:molybdopterin-guanine dinucleotide biosynthesis protein A